MDGRRAAALVLAIGSVTAFGENILYSLLSLYLKQNLGLSNVELGLFYLVLSLSSIVLRIPVGVLADLFGRARLVLAGLLLFLLGRAALLFGGRGLAYASAALLGLGISMYYIPHAALTADVSSADRRGGMLGMFGKLNFLSQVAGATGLVLGGYISQFFGRASMIAASSLVIAVSAGLAAVLNRELPRGSSGGGGATGILRDLVSSLRDRFLALYLAANLASGGFFASFVFLQVLLSVEYHLPDGAIGLVLTFFTVVSAVSSYVAGRALSSRGRGELVAVQSVVWAGIAVLSAATFVSAPLPALLAFLTGLYALLGVIYPVGSAVLYSYVSPRLRASVGNIGGMIWRTGHSIGSATVPHVVDALGVRAFLVQAAVASFLAFAALRAAYRVYRRRLAAEQRCVAVVPRHRGGGGNRGG